MIGAYVDVIYKTSKRVEMIPGLRFDLFTSRLASNQPPPSFFSGGSLTNASAQVGVDPRLATRVSANGWLTWITTFGVSHHVHAAVYRTGRDPEHRGGGLALVS